MLKECIKNCSIGKLYNKVLGNNKKLPQRLRSDSMLRKVVNCYSVHDIKSSQLISDNIEK